MLFVAGLLLAQNSATQPDQPLNPVLRLLQAAEFRYETLDNFYSVKFSIANTERYQTVYLRKSREDYLSLQAREVYTLVWESKERAPTDLIFTLFQKRYSIGGLIYELPTEKQVLYRIRYRHCISDSMSIPQFKELMGIVAAAGDSIEKEISDKEDKF